MACTRRNTTALPAATGIFDRWDDGATTLPVAPQVDLPTSAFIFWPDAFNSSA
jgi:hypothetical protein